MESAYSVSGQCGFGCEKIIVYCIILIPLFVRATGKGQFASGSLMVVLTEMADLNRLRNEIHGFSYDH